MDEDNKLTFDNFRLAQDNESRPPQPIDPSIRSEAKAALMAKFPDEFHTALSWLIERFPYAFTPETDRVRPLKIDVDKDILEIAALEATWLSAEQLSRVMDVWVKMPAYRFAVRQGKRRRDLYGQRYEKMSPAHRGIPNSKKPPKLLAEEEANKWITQFRNVVNDPSTAPDDLKKPSLVINKLREIIPLLSMANPARDELSQLWLELRKKRRDEIRKLREDILDRAKSLLPQDTYEQIEAKARTRNSDDALAQSLAVEHERLAYAIDQNELVLLRRHLSRDDRVLAGREQSALQQEISSISKLIAATPSTARIFAEAAADVLPGHQFKQLATWRDV